jgi:hypothetical protein
VIRNHISFTNLTAESRRHIYKKPDFSHPDSMINNRLIALYNQLHITTGLIVLDVCRLEDCQPEKKTADEKAGAPLDPARL